MQLASQRHDDETAPSPPSACSACAICAICLDPVDSQPCILKCGHAFHSSCIIQSAVYDPRCPTCRCELATKPPPPTPQRVINVELTMNDLNSAVDDEYQAVRRRQLSYDARRRRFLRQRPELKREYDAMKLFEQQLRELERKISTRWSRESQSLWMGPSFAQMKRERMLLLRRIRRRERAIDAAVTRHLGERPEIDDDEEESQVLRAIARLGRGQIVDAAEAEEQEDQETDADSSDPS